MASAAHSAIWRDGAEPATQVGTEDIIEFNTGSVVNSGGYIVNTRIQLNSIVAVKENPGNALDPLEDTGFSGCTVILTGSAEDPSGTGDTLAHRFKRWMLEDKTTITTFPKGRFGLRLNDFPAFNLTPTSARGYILESIEFGRNGETSGKVEFIATLRFNGDIGTLVGGEYNW